MIALVSNAKSVLKIVKDVPQGTLVTYVKLGTMFLSKRYLAAKLQNVNLLAPLVIYHMLPHFTD